MPNAVFWDVTSRQRADPIVVELLRGRVLLLPHEHHLCIEQEATLFRQVTCCPLDRENVKTPEQASLLPSSCEGDDGAQVFLPSASRTRSTRWRQFDVEERRNTCFASILLTHRASRQFVSGRFGAVRTGGMSSQPELRGMRAVVQFLRQSAEPRAAPPTSPFMALVMDPRAVKAQARFPRCSSVCGCAAVQSSDDPGPWRSDR